MNKIHTPNDHDLLAPDKTEKLVPPQSTYIEQLGKKDYIRKVDPSKRKVMPKVNDIEISQRNYKPNPRHMNMSPQIQKDFYYQQYRMDNIPKHYDEIQLRKEFRKMGVNPSDLHLTQNTVNHLNQGRGYFTMNTRNPQKEVDFAKKLEILGIKTSKLGPINAINKKMI